MITHKPMRPIIVTSQRKTEAQELYASLAVLAYSDLVRHGFSELMAEQFLEKRGEVEFVTLCDDVPSIPTWASQSDQLALWADVLKYAKRLVFKPTV